MTQGDYNKRYIALAVIAGLIICSFILYLTYDIYPATIGLVITVSCIIYAGLLRKCDVCGKLGTLRVVDTKLIDRCEEEKYYRKKERSWESSTGKVHYQHTPYVDIVTYETYENTLSCKKCGATCAKEYKKKSVDTYPR